MSSISRNQSIIGIGAGATWGTAVNATNKLHGRITFSTSRGEFRGRDVGRSPMITEIVKLEESVDVTLTYDLAYHSEGNIGLAHLFGTDTSSLLNAHDYQHIFKLDDENDGEFVTLAWKVEDDESAEFPSVKWHTMQITHERNGVGEVQLQGIADKLVDNASTPENTAAELDALTFQSTQYQHAVLGGANHYFRMNAASGDALDSGDDLGIVSYTLNVARPLSRRHVLRGADTKYTKEPKLEGGDVTGTIQVMLDEIDSSVADFANLWQNSTQQKIEIFFDGDKITGDAGNSNASYKIAIPQAEPSGDFPEGYDLPDNTGRMQPGLTFNLLAPSSAPSGMTGNTDYLWITAVDARTTAYV